VARILINHHRNVAIECTRKDKWSVLVVGWAPVKRIKILNSEVDREWKTYDYNLNKAINRMMNSTIEDNAAKELIKIKEK